MAKAPVRARSVSALVAALGGTIRRIEESHKATLARGEILEVLDSVLTLAYKPPSRLDAEELRQLKTFRRCLQLAYESAEDFPAFSDLPPDVVH